MSMQKYCREVLQYVLRHRINPSGCVAALDAQWKSFVEEVAFVNVYLSAHGDEGNNNNRYYRAPQRTFRIEFL